MSPVLAVWWWLHPDYMAVTSVVLGILTLIAAGIIAWRQFVIMGRQTAMMAAQTAISERQESISIRQGEVAERQASMAELQHVAFVEQQVLFARCRVWVVLVRGRWSLSFRNMSRVPLNGIAWQVHTSAFGSPLDIRDATTGEAVEAFDGNNGEPEGTKSFGYRGKLERVIAPRERIKLASFVWSHSVGEGASRVLRWYVAAESPHFDFEGMLTFTQESNYLWSETQAEVQP